MIVTEIDLKDCAWGREAKEAIYDNFKSPRRNSTQNFSLNDENSSLF
jgi:hypothetical protein